MNQPAPLSPLQLKEHAFTIFSVKAHQAGTINGEPSLTPTVWYERIPNTQDQWRLVLTVVITSPNPAKLFAYESEVQIQGVFQVGQGFPEEQKEVLALVNGFSLLYSAVREMVLNITARSVYGAINLPTLSFMSIVQEAKKQKGESERMPEKAKA